MPANSATASGLATRYATAIFELAAQHDALDQVAADLAALRDLFAESPDLRRMADSPALSRADEGKAMAAIGAKAELSELTLKFLGVLAGHRRLAALGPIIEAYTTRLAEERGEVRAQVTSATKLPKKSVTLLQENLTKFVGKKVSLDVAVDPSLLGGLVVRVGSRMIDASLKSKLKGLELSMRGIG